MTPTGAETLASLFTAVPAVPKQRRHLKIYAEGMAEACFILHNNVAYLTFPERTPPLSF